MVMGFTTSSEDDAIRYLCPDSPKTPKIITTDAELSLDSTVVEEKLLVLQKQVRAYSVNEKPVLGLLVGSSLMLRAIEIEGGVISRFPALDKKDLSWPKDVLTVVCTLNAYMHRAAVEMNDTMRDRYPISRSRSRSVSTTSAVFLYVTLSDCGWFLVCVVL